MKKKMIAWMMIAGLAGATAGCGIVGGKDIGRDAALQTALEDAGVKESDTTRLKVTEDRDDGRKIYEIQFDADNREYDYEIQASDGSVLSVETEDINTVDGISPNASGNSGDGTAVNPGNQDGTGNQYGSQGGHHSNGANAGANVAVSQDQAIQIALDRVEGATAQDIRIEFDQDDGRCKYEGEIIYNNTEYEFEIDANSGTILEWSEERY